MDVDITLDIVEEDYFDTLEYRQKDWLKNYKYSGKSIDHDPIPVDIEDVVSTQPDPINDINVKAIDEQPRRQKNEVVPSDTSLSVESNIDRSIKDDKAIILSLVPSFYRDRSHQSTIIKSVSDEDMHIRDSLAEVKSQVKSYEDLVSVNAAAIREVYQVADECAAQLESSKLEIEELYNQLKFERDQNSALKLQNKKAVAVNELEAQKVIQMSNIFKSEMAKTRLSLEQRSMEYEDSLSSFHATELLMGDVFSALSSKGILTDRSPDKSSATLPSQAAANSLNDINRTLMKLKSSLAASSVMSRSTSVSGLFVSQDSAMETSVGREFPAVASVLSDWQLPELFGMGISDVVLRRQEELSETFTSSSVLDERVWSIHPEYTSEVGVRRKSHLNSFEAWKDAAYKRYSRWSHQDLNLAERHSKGNELYQRIVSYEGKSPQEMREIANWWEIICSPSYFQVRAQPSFDPHRQQLDPKPLVEILPRKKDIGIEFHQAKSPSKAVRELRGNSVAVTEAEDFPAVSVAGPVQDSNNNRKRSSIQRNRKLSNSGLSAALSEGRSNELDTSNRAMKTSEDETISNRRELSPKAKKSTAEIKVVTKESDVVVSKENPKDIVKAEGKLRVKEAARETSTLVQNWISSAVEKHLDSISEGNELQSGIINTSKDNDSLLQSPLTVACHSEKRLSSSLSKASNSDRVQEVKAIEELREYIRASVAYNTIDANKLSDALKHSAGTKTQAVSRRLSRNDMPVDAKSQKPSTDTIPPEEPNVDYESDFEVENGANALDEQQVVGGKRGQELPPVAEADMAVEGGEQQSVLRWYRYDRNQVSGSLSQVEMESVDADVNVQLHLNWFEPTDEAPNSSNDRTANARNASALATKGLAIAAGSDSGEAIRGRKKSTPAAPVLMPNTSAIKVSRRHSLEPSFRMVSSAAFKTFPDEEVREGEGSYYRTSSFEMAVNEFSSRGVNRPYLPQFHNATVSLQAPQFTKDSRGNRESQDYAPIGLEIGRDSYRGEIYPNDSTAAPLWHQDQDQQQHEYLAQPSETPQYPIEAQYDRQSAGYSSVPYYSSEHVHFDGGLERELLQDSLVSASGDQQWYTDDMAMKQPPLSSVFTRSSNQDVPGPRVVAPPPVIQTLLRMESPRVESIIMAASAAGGTANGSFDRSVVTKLKTAKQKPKIDVSPGKADIAYSGTQDELARSLAQGTKDLLRKFDYEKLRPPSLEEWPLLPLQQTLKFSGQHESPTTGSGNSAAPLRDSSTRRQIMSQDDYEAMNQDFGFAHASLESVGNFPASVGINGAADPFDRQSIENQIRNLNERIRDMGRAKQVDREDKRSLFASFDRKGKFAASLSSSALEDHSGTAAAAAVGVVVQAPRPPSAAASSSSRSKSYSARGGRVKAPNLVISAIEANRSHRAQVASPLLSNPQVFNDGSEVLVFSSPLDPDPPVADPQPSDASRGRSGSSRRPRPPSAFRVTAGQPRPRKVSPSGNSKVSSDREPLNRDSPPRQPFIRDPRRNPLFSRHKGRPFKDSVKVTKQEQRRFENKKEIIESVLRDFGSNKDVMMSSPGGPSYQYYDDDFSSPRSNQEAGDDFNNMIIATMENFQQKRVEDILSDFGPQTSIDAQSTFSVMVDASMHPQGFGVVGVGAGGRWHET